MRVAMRVKGRVAVSIARWISSPISQVLFKVRLGPSVRWRGGIAIIWRLSDWRPVGVAVSWLSVDGRIVIIWRLIAGLVVVVCSLIDIAFNDGSIDLSVSSRSFGQVGERTFSFLSYICFSALFDSVNDSLGTINSSLRGARLVVGIWAGRMAISVLIEGRLVGLRVARISWLASGPVEWWISPAVTWIAGGLKYRSNVNCPARGLVGRSIVAGRRESGSVGVLDGGPIVRLFIQQARGQERLPVWRSMTCLVIGRIGRTIRRLVGLMMSWRPRCWPVWGRLPDRLLFVLAWAALVAISRLIWWGSVSAARRVKILGWACFPLDVYGFTARPIARKYAYKS